MNRDLLHQFRAIVGESGLLSSPEDLHTYECDGLTNFRVMPLAVVLPANTEQVRGSCESAIANAFRLSPEDREQA